MTNALSAAAKILLVTVALPIAFLSLLFGRKERRSADEVVVYLKNFLHGGGGEWDWDDFISVPIADYALEAIRQRAAAVELPVTERGLVTLQELLSDAQRQAGG